MWLRTWLVHELQSDFYLIVAEGDATAMKDSGLLFLNWPSSRETISGVRRLAKCLESPIFKAYKSDLSNRMQERN